MGSAVSIQDIDTAHRVPTRSTGNGGRRPIICRFIRRLSKDDVTNQRRNASRVDPSAVGLSDDASLSAGILIDNNLSWKNHIDHISSKVSKGIGMIARLRHLVPLATLLNIYRSLIEPYISYGLIAWGQAANIQLNKVLISQKRALRLMYFVDSKAHSAPLFIHSRILPVTMLYYHLVSSLMHDINNHRVPYNISLLFTHSEQVHHHFTRFSAEKFEAQKIFSLRGFTALLPAKTLVLYDKTDQVSICNIQVHIKQINVDVFQLEALIQRNRSLSEHTL